MPIYSGFPLNGSKDWDAYGSTATSITIDYITDSVGVPTSNSWGYVVLNTSAVTTGGTITAATLTWWVQSYSRVGTDAISNSVYLWDGSGYNVQAYLATTALAARYITTALTSSAQLACINASGGVETALLFRVNTPVTNPGSNIWKINAYESGSTVCTRIGIRYNNPTSSRRRIFFIG